MASASFKKDVGAPPVPRPRTPDPIVSAIEPIPEAAVAIAELLKRDPHPRRPTTRNPQKPRSDKRGSKATSSRSHKHSHSHSASFALPASPIDTLASVAVFEATSRSPPTFHNLYQSQYPFERSSKRARSEIAPSPQLPAASPLFDQITSHRPATSYINNGWGYNVEQGINQGQRMRAYSAHTRSGSVNGAYPESNVDEAELLLNFSRGGSSHGLGISAPSAAGTKNNQRTPALPPFPFAASEQPSKAGGAVENGTENAIMSSPVRQAPPHSPISPYINSEALFANLRDRSVSPLQRPAADPIVDETDQADLMDVSRTEPKTETEDCEMPDAPALEAAVDGEESLPPPPLSNTLSEQLAKLPTNSLHVPDLDSRRYSDSHKANPFKRVRLDPGRRSASVPLEYAVSESTEPSTLHDGQAATEDTTPRMPEQGAICPACNNESDVPLEKVSWLQCDGCDQWYHEGCSGLTAKQSKGLDKYYCKTCEPKFGQSTKKRTSTRTRNTVDYAGLNEGVLRQPDENREHHYIEAFKAGDIELTPETFPRIPGNEITAEFFEKCWSFDEPVLVPNSLNPRPKFPGTTAWEELTTDDDRVRVPDEGQDDMDMVIPQELTVRRVAQHYGPKNQIPVIDVKAQESSKGWTVEKWADYYENPGEEPIRNVISLECSQTPLWRLIRRPKVVRDIDLQDSVWPDNELRRSVGFYVLMSVADSYTDFHIDFGGSSVYYHILKGKKVFFFIRPTRENLQKYQEWNDMPSQTWTWLPEITKSKECFRVDLYPGDTMLIPAGWIHAVWTPDDSLVIGGNFLTRLHYGMQFRVADIEKANKTPITFRYPKFQKVMWYAVLQYLDRDPLPASVRGTFLDGRQFARERPVWSEFDKFGENSDAGAENFNARYYPKAELDGLPDLVNYVFRTVMISLDRVENIAAKTRKAVIESIPKTSGREPLEAARDFAMWVAWKRGNEDIPEWAHPGAVLPKKAEDTAEGKKLTDAQMKKMQKASAINLPERQSARLKSVAETAITMQQEQVAAQPAGPTASTPKTSSLGPRRTACDSCRKRKMRCKHVENNPAQSSEYTFINPVDASPQSSFVGVVVPTVSPQHQPPAPSFSPTFQVDSLATMTNGFEPQGFMPGPKQEYTELKKGRTKACYECRRSKRRCIHDEFGKVDPIKQREPVVPRGSTKRKSGPGPEMPLAKKPNSDQVAPIAPMLPGGTSFGSPTPAPAPANPPPFVQTKQDGMFRNSTVNDFSAMTGVVNVNPLASRNAQAPRPSTNGVQQSPSRQPPTEWVLDPALMDPSLGTPEQQPAEDEDYADAQEALMAYFQSNNMPPQSSQEAANQFMNGFVDYEAGGSQPPPKQEMDIDIDPMLQDAIPAAQVRPHTPVATNGVGEGNGQPLTNGFSKAEESPIDPALMELPHHTPNHNHDHSNGTGTVLPSTEATPLQQRPAFSAPNSSSKKGGPAPQTPRLDGSAVKSMSPDTARSAKSTGKRKERSATLEEADPETRRLIEQLRQEDLQTRGLRRRS